MLPTRARAPADHYHDGRETHPDDADDAKVAGAQIPIGRAALSVVVIVLICAAAFLLKYLMAAG